MRVLGLMSGTSFDAVDAAVVDFRYSGGVLTARVVWSCETPMPAATKAQLRAILPPAEVSLETLVSLDTSLGKLFAEVAARAQRDCSGIDAICSHGQTVFHWVKDGKAQGTLQIGQPAWIAQATGLPVVADIRARDIAAGGQGAPLVSFLDALLLQNLADEYDATVAAALNLGGIANVTVLDTATNSVSAWDTGPASALIDACVADRGLSPRGFDEGGTLAAAGTFNHTLLEILLGEPYYQRPAPKSTGKELFNLHYVNSALQETHRRTGSSGKTLNDADVVATLTELTAETVAASLAESGAQAVMVSGGGARNTTLMTRLQEKLPGVPLVPTERVGVSTDMKEALLCALIGWCTLHGVPATLPGVTGASDTVVLGSITPGNGPLVLPEPSGPIRQLVLEGNRDDS